MTWYSVYNVYTYTYIYRNVYIYIFYKLLLYINIRKYNRIINITMTSKTKGS